MADPSGVFTASIATVSPGRLGPAAFAGGGKVGIGIEYQAKCFGIGVYADEFLSDLLEKHLKVSAAVGLRIKL